MDAIKEKIQASKNGAKNPNARSIKCYNIETKEELYFDTVKECKEYFGEKHHRFITTRVLYQTKSLYKEKWKFAYADEDYKDFSIERARLYKQIYSVDVIDTVTNITTHHSSIASVCRTYGFNYNKFHFRKSNKLQLDKYIINIHNEKCIDYL